MTSVDDYQTPVTLSDGHVVSATVTAPSGSSTSGSLDLDTIVGNVNGALSWGGSGFSSGAQNVQMTDGYTLSADLPDSNGSMVHSELYIGAGVDTLDGQETIRFGVLPPYSEAHAQADNNEQADSSVHAQAQASDSAIVKVQTVQGNAADYWPEGNAPAAGHSHAGRIAATIGIIIWRAFSH